MSTITMYVATTERFSTFQVHNPFIPVPHMSPRKLNILEVAVFIK